jgi:hypothetical protein
LSRAKDRRRGGRPHALRPRMRRSRTPRGTHGFDMRDFGFFDFPTSSSSADCRLSSSAFARRCARRELAPFSAKRGRRRAERAGWGVESRTPTMNVSCDASRKASASTAAGHTPSGPSCHLPQQGWGRVRGDIRAIGLQFTQRAPPNQVAHPP